MRVGISRLILSLGLSASLAAHAQTPAPGGDDHIRNLIAALDTVQRSNVTDMAGTVCQASAVNPFTELKADASAEEPVAPAPAPAPAPANLPGLSKLFAEDGANKACSEYISGPGGKYGEKGQKMMDAFNKDEKYYDALLGEAAGKTESMQLNCPNFSKMSKDERKHFWVWAFASIAWMETKCGIPRYLKEKTDVTGRRVVGEFQMNAPYKDRYWRGSAKNGAPWNSKGYCAASSVSDFNGNLMCAMDIMMGQFMGEYGRPPGLAGPSYFAELRTGDRPSRIKTSPILKRIRSHPGCGAPSEAEIAGPPAKKKGKPATKPKSPSRKKGKRK